MQKRVKRLIPALLAVLMLFGCLYPAASAAVGDSVTYEWSTAYQNGNAANGDYKMNGFNIDILTIHGGSYDGRIAYCINHGARYVSSDRVVTGEGASLEDSEYWGRLRAEGKDSLLQHLMPHI